MWRYETGHVCFGFETSLNVFSYVVNKYIVSIISVFNRIASSYP